MRDYIAKRKELARAPACREGDRIGAWKRNACSVCRVRTRHPTKRPGQSGHRSSAQGKPTLRATADRHAESGAPGGPIQATIYPEIIWMRDVWGRAAISGASVPVRGVQGPDFPETGAGGGNAVPEASERAVMGEKWMEQEPEAGDTRWVIYNVGEILPNALNELIEGREIIPVAYSHSVIEASGVLGMDPRYRDRRFTIGRLLVPLGGPVGVAPRGCCDSFAPRRCAGRVQQAL